MKRIISILLWFFGVFFIIPGIIGICTSDYAAGLLFLMMGLVCLPPAGGKIPSKTVRIILFIVCIGAFAPLGEYQKAQKQAPENMEYFKENHSSIIANTQKNLDKKDYEAVVLVADKYAFAKDQELIALKSEAQKLLEIQKKEEEKYSRPSPVIKEVGYFKSKAKNRIFTISFPKDCHEAGLQKYARGLSNTDGRMTAAYFYPEESVIPADGVTLAKNIEQANRVLYEVPGLSKWSYAFMKSYNGRSQWVNCIKTPDHDLCRQQ